jgi:DNA-binding transcriptional MerR regulator
MGSPSRDIPKPARGLKIKDLEEATGVGREAIRFYIREGLLPAPQRPRRNVAFYDRSFVDRLRLIKELQRRRFLPLRVIKAIIAGDAELAPAEARTVAEVDRYLFQTPRDDRRRGALKLEEVLGRTGYSEDDLQRMEAVGAIKVVSRKGRRWIDHSDVRLIETWARLRDAGFTEDLGFRPEDLRLYVDMVRWLVREEVRLFTSCVTGKVASDRSAAMVEAAIELVSQLIGTLHTTLLLREIARDDARRAANPAVRWAKEPQRGVRGRHQ